MSTTYKPTNIAETPFLKAKQEWDSRFGNQVKHAQNWRLLSGYLILVIIAMTTALVVQSNKATVIPVLVGLRDSGEPVVIGNVYDKKFEPTDSQISYFLTQIVRFLRTVPKDEVLYKNNWVRAYTMLRPSAAKQLEEMSLTDDLNPTTWMGKGTAIIQPRAVLRIPGSNSYQISWLEVRFDTSGRKIEEYEMQATFTIEIEEPKDLATLTENPLGIFVKSFEWLRQL